MIYDSSVESIRTRRRRKLKKDVASTLAYIVEVEGEVQDKDKGKKVILTFCHSA